MRDPHQILRVGVDVETTGLKPGPDKLLEIALVVANAAHEILYKESHVCLVDTAAAYGQTGKFVQDMHTKNGLWNDCYIIEQADEHIRAAATYEAVETRLLEVLGGFGFGINAKTNIWGYNPGFDLSFLEVFMPKLAKCFRHSPKGDIRSVELMMTQLGFPKWEQTDSDHPHRALDDMLDEFASLEHYESQLVRLV